MMVEPPIHGRRAKRTLRRQPAPSGIWASSWDPEVGLEIVRRVAAGESLRSICRADVRMPTEKTVWNWSQRNPDFAHALAWAQGEARAAHLAAQKARDAARLAGIAERWGARGRAAPKDSYSYERSEAVCLGLLDGSTLAQVCRRPGMPSIATVYNWLRRHPEFVERYRSARRMQVEMVADIGADQALALGWREGRRVIAETNRRMGALAPKGWSGRRVAGGRVTFAPEGDGGG